MDCLTVFHITYGNDKYFPILDSPRVEYKHVRWADYVVPEDMDHILAGLEAIVEAKAPRNFEFRLNRPSIGGDDIVGETWVTASGYPDLNGDGSIKEIGTMCDISRYKWAENAQKRRAQEALESKRQQEK
jgi:hypothetical protein